MIEIKLVTKEDFAEAQKWLDETRFESGKKDYKPCVIYGMDFQKWKTRQQMKAIRSIIQELYTNGMHSCPYEGITLQQFTVWVKTTIIKLIEVEEVFDPRSKEFKKRYSPKSMGDYTKKEMTQAIENLLAYVRECNAHTPKMEKILEGMENNNKNKE